MNNRIKKNYFLDKNSINYIDKIKNKYNLKYQTDALELIIREHENKTDISTETIIKLIAQEVASELKSSLTPIKLASNKTDKNTQIIIELINGFFVKSNYRSMASTDEIKADAIDKMTKVVEERIEKQRIEKLDKMY